MPTAEKAAIIEKAKKWYGDSTGLIFTDYRGLDVPAIQTLRSSLRDTGGEFHVVKNTLLRQAVGKGVEQFPEEFHNGPTATLFIFREEAACAKVLVKFAKDHKGFEIKGGVIDGKPMTAAQINELSKLPSRDELLSMIVGLVQAPIANVVGALNEMIAGPIRCIDAIVEKQGGASAPAAEEAPAAAEAAVEEAPAVEATAEEAPAAEAAADEAQAETAQADPDPKPEEEKKDGPQSVDDEPAEPSPEPEAGGPQSFDDEPAKPEPEPDPEP
jgi:large subunit ribosomal protein L10